MDLTKEQLRQVLVESEGISEEQFEAAARAKESNEIGIDGVLVSHGVLKDEEVGQLLAIWYNRLFVNLKRQKIDDKALEKIPEAFARAHLILPLWEKEGNMFIATSEPNDVVLQSLLEKYLREKIEFVYSTPRDLKDHLYVFQKDPETAIQRVLTSHEQRDAQAKDTTVIELVDVIINYAYQGGASDIHIEPEESHTVVRYRTDGILHDIAEIPLVFHEPMMTRLKVLSRLPTDEHRKALDGKIEYKTPWAETIEIRLSLLPTTQAEKAVMRLLSDKSRRFSLADLGLEVNDFKKVSEMIHRPWGMILVTGPTGCGKTTTLYSVLKVLNRREVNITSIEDPVEYDMEGVNQIQVNEKADLTFAKGLRSIVRQDPDIIMVGEIRDSETAGIAINAAMTGHLVLSTLHTNDAATAFPRLVDMGVEDFLIASTVNIVIAQRLVRQICPSCIQSTTLTRIEIEEIKRVTHVEVYLKEITTKNNITRSKFYRGIGCKVCNNSGYHGRIGVFEILLVTEQIRQAIMERKNADEIRAIALAQGMTSMLYDGLRKFSMGKTTLEEVMRVTRE